MIVRDAASVPFVELQSSLLWFGIVVEGGSCIPPPAVSTPGVTCSNAVSGAACGANSSAVSRAVSCAIAAVLRMLFLALFWMLSRRCFERFLFVVLVLPCAISSGVSGVK